MIITMGGCSMSHHRFLNNGVIMKAARRDIFSNGILALVDLIKCKCCDGEIVQVSGKNGGHYGCYNAKRESCNNKLLISSRQVEAIILNDLKEKFLTVDSLKYIDEFVLKDLLEMVELESVPGDRPLANAYLIKSCSYYVAYTSIQTVALLDEVCEPDAMMASRL